ncbi:hypothetical protein EUX98_g6647 [Antrodiella citrinella]|uniref:Polysaccharide lyase 14 domain-containing protein n=1 Tax=Antrodiella citrinella TaxID=2447956 RepID=A0A4S4MNH1_9APHY|nr:hypothetical protein EUX98_g6647 [Antrodiella citrinella]
MSSSLFPVSPDLILTGFTTSPLVPSNIPHIALVPLTDAALGVHKVTAQTTHNVVSPPPPASHHNGLNELDDALPTEAWEAFYPAGSINPGNKEAPRGGFGFYMRGPKAWKETLDREGAGEVLVSYRVMFEEGWAWRKGGKLPGLYGGVGESAYGCTGGRQTDRCNCFNLRLMWRENGAGELYAYLPHHAPNPEQMVKVPPKSVQHPDYGFSVGMGSFYFAPGVWTTVAERLKMNTIGQADGEIEVYIDGKSVIRVQGIVLRDAASSESHVQGIHFQTFFGGHSNDWASPKPQRAYFGHVSGAILRSPSGVQHLHEEL